MHRKEGDREAGNGRWIAVGNVEWRSGGEGQGGNRNR